MSRTGTTAAAIWISALLLLSPPAGAGSHLWRFNEIYSDPSGQVQFIELKECCGAANEIFIGGKDVSSEATGRSFVFPGHLPCTDCTADQHLLLATAAFADLPGAPTPDYLIEPGLFSLDGDTLRYWLYANATFTYGPGSMPLDGIRSLGGDGSPVVNSPTNFAGETGSVDLRCRPADLDGNGAVDVQDLSAVILAWGPNPAHPADVNQDGIVDVQDLTDVILAWGPCR